MSRISDHVYYRTQRDGLPDGWEALATSTAKSGNGFFGALYRRTDPATGEQTYAIAFRGTDGVMDMASNISIALGHIPDQYYGAMDFTRDMCKAYNLRPSDLKFTGHSLGGYLARTVAASTGADKVYAFNSPGPTKAVQRELNSLLPKGALPGRDTVIHIRSRSDIIGLWGYDEGITIELETSANHHGLRNIQHQLARKLGVEDKPAPSTDKKPGMLMQAFNKVSEKISRSALLRAAIRKLFSYSNSTSSGKAPAVRAQTPGMSPNYC